MTDAALTTATIVAYYEQLTPENRRIVGQLVLSLLRSQPAQPTPFTAADHLQEWLLSLAVSGTAKTTTAAYHRYLSAFIRQQHAPTIQGITAFLATKPVPSIGNTLSALKSFFTFARRMGYIGASPCDDIPTPRRQSRIRSAPPAEHIAPFLAALHKHRDRALFVLLLDTGARISEALHAPRTAFNADARTLTVIGKGDKQRVLHLHPEAGQALATHLATLPENTHWLFPGRSPQRPLDRRAAEELMARICKRAGIPKYTPHQLRHAYATTMLSRGAPLPAVSRSMGHASPSITANVYWHVLGEQEIIDAHDKYGPLTDGGRR